MTRFRGTGASSGAALGMAVIFRHPAESSDTGPSGPTGLCGPEAFEKEWDIFLRARAEVEAELRALAAKTSPGEAGIFEGYAEILLDSEIEDGVKAHIAEGLNAAAACRRVLDKLAAEYKTLDAYMAGRAGDIADLGKKLQQAAAGSRVTVPEISEPCILIADELSPFEAAQLDRRLIKALALDTGGTTGHAAILARSLGIPCVLGLGDASQKVQGGTLCALDGDNGILIIDPAEQEAELFKNREAAERQNLARCSAMAPVSTRDGVAIAVCANIGRTLEGREVLEQGADGVGLLRTEFLYLDRDVLPGEEEQFAAYKAIVESLEGRPLTIRTLDIGGDKEFPALGLEKEANPFLGYRAIRISLHEREIFKIQLRAALRAAAFGIVEIMFPLIISVGEFKAAKALVNGCKAELGEAGLPFGNPPLGVMIETPAAALLAGELAREADFFSLGTNDLTQYTLAVDRGNARIAELYNALHPAVLRLIAGTCDAAARTGIPVCLCGELAGNEKALPLLLGLGLGKLSMAGPRIPIIKEKIKTLNAKDCRTLAQKALGCADPEEVQALLPPN